MLTASFRYTAPTGNPISAIARFGPEGMIGNFATGPFTDIADALLTVPGGRNMAVRLRSDGTFESTGADTLPQGQFLSEALLNDAQQKRQDLYRAFLKRPRPGWEEGRPLMLAWATPIDMHFEVVQNARTAGTALLVIPLQLRRADPGTLLTIPAPVIPWRRVVPGGLGRSLFESADAVSQRLRFQLPAETLPLRIESAKLTAKIDAPSRQVTISAIKNGEPIEIQRVHSPLDLIRVDIKDASLLHLDEKGGLHFDLVIGESARADDSAQKWRIDYVELEVTGRAQ